MVRDISNYFTRAELNNSKGKLILSNEDRTNTGEIIFQKQVDMLSDINIKPKVYKNFDNHALDGSYAVINNGEEVYVKNNGKWILLYKENQNTLFRVPYYDPAQQYNKDNIVAYNFKKYKSVADIITVGKTPDTIDFNFELNNNSVVAGSNIYNINNIHIENDKLIIVATDYIYIVINEDPVVYNRNAKGVNTKAITIAGIEFRVLNNKIIEVKNGDTEELIEFSNEFVSMTGYGEYLYVYSFADKTIYKINISTLEKETFMSNIDIDCNDITINSSYMYFANYSLNKIFKFDLTTKTITEHTLANNIDSIAVNDNGELYYHVINEDNIRKAVVQSGEWIEVSDEYFFKRFNCPQPFIHKISYENIIDENKYHYTDKYLKVAYFCFMSNKYLFAIENGSRGKLIQYDISNGVLNERYTGKFRNLSMNVGGIAYFQGGLIVAKWQSLLILDPETLEEIRSVYLGDKIEDAKIIGLTSRGDTLYVMTTNYKVYKLQDVDAPISGTVTLELGSSDMRICAINSSELYCSINGEIWNQSLDDGSLIEKTPLGRGVQSDIDLMNFELFTLELDGSNSIVKYKTTFSLIEG